MFFGITPIDASVIGAMSLATAYAIGDVLSLNHSLHRKRSETKGFYCLSGGLVVLATALLRLSGRCSDFTVSVQTLSGALPSGETVFQLRLYEDDAVRGLWVNGRALNVFSDGIVGMLVILSDPDGVGVLSQRRRDRDPRHAHRRLGLHRGRRHGAASDPARPPPGLD